MRQVIITFADGVEFAPALDHWLETEPFIQSMSFGLGRRVTATLYAPVDGTTGESVDDHARALAVLRQCVPVELVATAMMDGRDWLHG